MAGWLVGLWDGWLIGWGVGGCWLVGVSVGWVVGWCARFSLRVLAVSGLAACLLFVALVCGLLRGRGLFCVALLHSRRRMDFRTGLGSTGWSDQKWLPAGVDSPLVERLWAVAGWISRLFIGMSVWASVCVCVPCAGWISGQWMHARMGFHGLLFGYVARALCVLVCRALALVACVRVG